MENKVWDVIVLGGGLTGVAAAISARRQGLSVLIAEKFGSLGGAPATCLINPYMRYWTDTEQGGEKRRFVLSRGIFSELNDELERSGGLRGGQYIHEEYVKRTLDRMVCAEGVDVLFHAMLCGVDMQNGHISGIRVATKSGVLYLKAKAFIDCSGDADLAVMCGCPYHLGRPGDELCQPMTLCFRLANVDMEKYRANRALINETYKRFQAEGKIKNPREDVLIFDTLVDGMLHFNTTRIVRLNPVDPFDLSRAEMLAREQMFEIYDFLKDNIPGFERSQIAYSASEIGVRESRMIDGEYMLTETDLKDCVKFPDRIAAGNYDIDIHNPEGSGTSHYYFPEGTWYTIPYRCLVPRGANNLLVAGRCVSATHEAQASIRILPIVTTLGQAAGTAAAMAVKSGCDMRDVDIPDLQRALGHQGAFIG